MLIENPDAFKSWLTSVLEPLCDADPEALAKYVFALVKKDKSIDILRQGMLEQLDVFLQAETKPFVELLFKTIETQDYLLIPNTNPPNPNFTPKKSPEMNVKDIKPIIPVSTLPNLTESLNGVKKPGTEEQKEVVSTTTAPTTTVNKRSDDRRRRRSRSRSWDRRSPRRRPWRNKSPPRRAWRSRSRSPRHVGSRSGRYRNRSPPRSPTRSRSRSPVRSPPERSRDKKKDDKQPDNENSGAATPTQDSNHGDTDMRLTSTTQSIQSVVAASSGAVSSVGPPSAVVGAAEPYKRRCRDFDEKGYCMRGEMCPYDHGIDPVVLEDSALSRVLTFGGAPPSGPQIGPQMRPPHHINMHQPPGPLAPPGVIVEYNPQNPAMWRGIRPPRGVLGPGGPQMHPQNQRELISIPVQELIQQPMNQGFKRSNHHNDMPQKRAKFDYNRLGIRPAQKSANNCSLELKKVPRGLNNITHLNNHFAKFGKIINIQVNFENDPEAALVTFSTHAEANAAYRSTEAVLNNRFIKVFWRSVQENVPPVQNSQNQTHSSVKDRLGKVLNPVDPSSVQTEENQSTADDKEKVTPVLNKNNVIDSKKDDKLQEMLKAKEQLKKKQEEKRKEAIKLTQDLRKRKQELLEKQLAQQKLLIEKLEKTPSGQHRDLLMSTIKTVQESIESIRKELLPPLPAPGTKPGPTTPAKPHKKTREEAQREVLDVELDLMTRQAEGGDTSELQRRLAELKAQAQRIAPGRGGPGLLGVPAHRRTLMRGRGGARAMYHVNRANLTLDRTKVANQGEKGAQLSKNVVDHRPKNVLISGYELDEADAVLAHFAQYGEIVEYSTDSSTPSLTLSYKTRKEAEVALVKGRNFRDRTLSVTWCTGVQQRTRASSFTSGPQKIIKPIKTENDENKKDEEVKPEVKVEEKEKEVEDPKIEPKEEETAAAEPVEEAEPPEEKENELLLDADDENMLLTDGDVVSGDVDVGVDVSEEVLLQDDEEDEETEDDRSWRR